ncbi:hypothetical protein SAMN05443633_102529 [Chryseobacterium arachidis]|uniref:Uncharacterized protein n=1 Tax=Chryseobacterium arachidis TaxID=1416778 RepID=A0A1M4Y700_9FLAO|nr:hypothetical protein [Chryseobacterium arachidis]SHF01488.1 hypothetical protein SAMN05443633_102529 [Chryseobacterium arachidis]
MKKLASFYFIVLAALNLIMDSIHVGFRFIDLIFLILAGLPLLVNRKWMYKIFGGIISLICFYILVAVFISNLQWIQQNKTEPFWMYGMGYVISLISLSMGLLMMNIVKIKKEVVKI